VDFSEAPILLLILALLLAAVAVEIMGLGPRSHGVLGLVPEH
jgi:hypothetical protein